MRVPYAPTTPPTPSAAPIYDRIAARRAPRPLIPLDLTLLHNPAVADGWNSFIGAIRTQTSIPEGLRELAIARVAVLNHAVHEWDVHAALALKAGIGKVVMADVLSRPVSKRKTREGETKSGDKEGEREGTGEQWKGWKPEEKAVLLFTDQMTIGVTVEEEVMQGVKTFLSDGQVVELTATVAAYNCVSRVLVALDVGECNGRGMKGVQEL